MMKGGNKIRNNMREITVNENISIIDENNRIKIPDEILSYLGVQKEIIIEYQNKKIYLKKP